MGILTILIILVINVVVVDRILDVLSIVAKKYEK